MFCLFSGTRGLQHLSAALPEPTSGHDPSLSAALSATHTVSKAWADPRAVHSAILSSEDCRNCRKARPR